MNEGSERRTRRTAVVAAIIAAAVALAGCSSSGVSEDSAASYDGGAAEEAAAGEAALSDSGGDGAEPDADQGTEDRSLIVTGSLYITVDDPLVAADRAAQIVEGAGGRIDARNETAADEYEGGSAWLTLRIPDDRLDAVVDDLRELGTVDEFSTESRDVTTEVTDLETKISTLRDSTARIQSLLLEAEDIEDIITLEDELSRRQAELESLEARQRGLDDQVSMSTIELSLTTEPVVVVDNSPQTFTSGLESGWEALVAFFSTALVIVGVLLPWLALVALVSLAVLALVRTRRARASRPASAGPATKSAAAPTTDTAPASGPTDQK